MAETSTNANLVTTDNQWLGSMKMYRFYTDRALFVDTNLWTVFFPVVLADALDRALVPKPSVVPDGHNRYGLSGI